MPRKISKEIPGKILQDLYNKNPRPIAAERQGQQLPATLRQYSEVSKRVGGRGLGANKPPKRAKKRSPEMCPPPPPKRVIRKRVQKRGAVHQPLFGTSEIYDKLQVNFGRPFLGSLETFAETMVGVTFKILMCLCPLALILQVLGHPNKNSLQKFTHKIVGIHPTPRLLKKTF